MVVHLFQTAYIITTSDEQPTFIIDGRPQMAQPKKPSGRRVEAASRAKPAQVERTDRTSRRDRVTALADQIFGDRAKAHRWLSKPKHELNGVTPLACLANDAGAERVTEMLYRIDSGFFA